MDKEILAEYLRRYHHGSENAVVSKTMERRFAMKGKALRALVNALRRDGVPIASDQNGYFYAKTETELRATVHHMKCRIAGIEAAISGLNRTLAAFDGSQTRPPIEGGGCDEN